MIDGKQDAEQLNLLDNFLFGKTLGYKELGKKVSRIILKTILDREVIIRDVVSENVILPAKPGLHVVRLDAFIEEKGTEVTLGNIYDLEPDKQLLAYMKNSTPENACNPDLEQIHSCINKVKKGPKVQEVFMTLEEYVERENDEVKEQERKRADKADRQIITIIHKTMSSGDNKSAGDAMDELGIDADMRDYYKAML